MLMLSPSLERGSEENWTPVCTQAGLALLNRCLHQAAQTGEHHVRKKRKMQKDDLAACRIIDVVWSTVYDKLKNDGHKGSYLVDERGCEGKRNWAPSMHA